MEIKYLKKLEANPNEISSYDGSIVYTIKGMTEAEIQEFELYLKVKFSITDPNFKLPQAYKEYLFLAGKKDYLFETGGDTKQFLQEIGDDELADEGVVLPDPYCVMDCGGDAMQFYYWTSADDDPIIYQILYSGYSRSGNLEFINCGTLSQFIERKINLMLEGKSFW